MSTVIGDEYRLSDRYEATDGRVLLSGVQALARLPIEQLRRDRRAGLDTAAFLSGYPGSPLGGLDLEIARAAATATDLPIVHQPAVNEELGATAVMGSQLAPGRPDATYEGVVGFWYGKAPGLDRAGDALRHGVFAGSSARGGAVVLVGDDPDCKSSTMPSSSDATLVDLHMPILYPGTVQECLELGLHAVAMSRATGLWSSMKIVAPIADGSGTVDLPTPPDSLVVPTVEVGGEIWECTPSAQFLGQRMVEVEREFREIRLPLARRYGVENGLNRVSVNPQDAWVGIVATGFTYVEVLDALRRLGLSDHQTIADAGIRILQLRMPVPFDAELVRTFAAGLEEIIVIEEKNPTLEWLVKDALYGGAGQPRVVGKNHEDGRMLMQSWGRLDADAILPGLRARLSRRLDERLAPERNDTRQLIPLAVTRTPFFCSGCPHNWGTKVPDDAVVGAGTGCHGMSLLMDSERVGEGIGITAMGNEGAQWVGMEPFVETDHLFQNYGDGTYFHSGQLAVQYCIGAGKNVTFKILYNGTVAMTGGQDAAFAIDVPELCGVLQHMGVAKIAITTDDVGRYRHVDLPPGVEVHDRTAIVGVQEDLRATPGVTVLVHDQRCAAEVRRDRRRGRLETPERRVVINHRICEGCGDCGDVSNCLSVQPIETPLGRKTAIDQESCNLDLSCLGGDCPAFMTVEPLRPRAATDGRRTAMPDVAEPPTRLALDSTRIRMAGIGGTGVVTVAQILATAALFDGWDVHGLDQTGLSQKAGPVISDVALTRPGCDASNLVGAGEADLLLGFDALVAASDPVLKAANPARTVVIASTHRTPTGRMISHPDIPYPDESIVRRLAAVGRPEEIRLVDAFTMSEQLTGHTASANVFLLGLAVQSGHLPLTTGSVEKAIGLNGVAVEANIAAFGWGRRFADDPDAVRRAAGEGGPAPGTPAMVVPDLPASLERRTGALGGDPALGGEVAVLAADLIGYQDRAYASSFLDHVEEVAVAESGVVGEPGRLTERFARSLHKLMAYKDEYEVARLMLSPEAADAAAAAIGGDATVTWHLAPPTFRAFGRDGKIAVGRWAAPVFGALSRMKRMRGSAFDPFGRTELRRAERSLPEEFVQAMRRVLDALDSERLGQAVAIAALPDGVRGFEDLKMRRIADFRRHLDHDVRDLVAAAH